MFTDVFLYVFISLVFIVLVTAAFAGWKAAPYVPTWQRDVRRMLQLAQVKPGELVVDLGSGDGRFLVTASQEFGSQAVGYELSLLPYVVSLIRKRISRANRISVKFRDFYRADLSPADVVVCFLTPKAMKKLEPKFERELRPGTRVVSFAFRLPGWPSSLVDKPTPQSTPVFVYRVQANPRRGT